MDGITRQDLELYRRAIEESDEKKASALRDVAVHFAQVVQLLKFAAKNDEAILTSVTQESRAVIEAIKEQLNEATRKLGEAAEANRQSTDAVHKVVAALEKTINDNKVRNSQLITLVATVITLIMVAIKTFFST